MKKKSALKKIVKKKINLDSSTDEEAEIDYIQNIYDEDKDLYYVSKQKEDKENEILDCENKIREKHVEPENLKFLLPIKEDGKLIPRYQRVPKEIVSKCVDEPKEVEKELFKKYKNDNKKTSISQKFENIFQFKIYLANLANSIIENPEEHILKINKILTLLKQENYIIEDATENLKATLLIVATLSEIFKDIIPGYNIRLPTDTEKKQLAKKETRKLRTFEENLLLLYKKFIDNIIYLSRVRKGSLNQKFDPSVQLIIATTYRELLLSKPHFNYRKNIITSLVPLLNSKNDEVSRMSHDAIRDVLLADETGDVSLETVRAINHFVKGKGYFVRREVIDVFTYLRLEEVNRPLTSNEGNGQDKRQHTTIKDRKTFSRNDIKKTKAMERLNKDMEKTEAVQTVKARGKNDTDISNLIFTIYFKILRDGTQRETSGTLVHSLSSRRLLSAVLRGLSTFAHVINVEFFHDLISSLYTLAASERTTRADKLNAIMAAFSILSGQSQGGFNIDLSRFYRSLYDVLSPFDPDITDHSGEAILGLDLEVEINPTRSLLPFSRDELSLLTKCLELAVLKRHKHVPAARVAAYAKRLALLSLSSPSTEFGEPDPRFPIRATVLYLALLQKLVATFPSIRTLFETERSGDNGIYSMEVRDPDFCQAQNTSLWELCTLSRSYDPLVKDVVRHVLRPIKDDDTPSQLLSVECLKMYQNAVKHDASRVKPAPTTPDSDNLRSEENAFIKDLFVPSGESKNENDSGTKVGKKRTLPRSNLNRLITKYRKLYKSFL